MATVAVPVRASVPADAERRFFVVMAGVSVGLALFGFTQRYFMPLATGTQGFPYLVHAHGVFMWAWTVLFFAQSWLAYTGRLRRHRAFGMAGIALLTLCVWTGATIAIQQLAGRLDGGMGDPARAFAIMPTSLVVSMAVLFVAAIAQARRPEAHSRLMLLVTLVALNPALARIVGMVVEPRGVRNAILGGTLMLVLVGVAMVRDRVVRGRIHPAYLWGGGFVFAVQIVRATLHDSPAWYAVADAMVALTH